VTGEDSQTVVRMGELATSRTAGHELVTIGLGSCIGLVLIDGGTLAAGLAHVMLPASSGPSELPAKFADHAVPALLAAMVALGCARSRLRAVLVGGAQMFSFGGSGLEIGRRNEEATLAALEAERIPVVGSFTGGSAGRTVRVEVGAGRVSVKTAGGEAEMLEGIS
jgi:chemotaxis protein CheD